jgi:CheY-like chemotaxis protein/two-component sensor histidine kinase
LMLAEQLQDNPDSNMTKTQVEYASVILSSGRDLLKLLNNILDLAKVESGTVTVEETNVSLAKLRTDLLREFEPVARERSLAYSVEIAPECPRHIFTDPQRLGQILRNLLANAFKFTSQGEVRLEVCQVEDGWSEETVSLVDAASVVAFTVSDTGVGIEADQLQRIFEAFAQGDGSTSRLYGGTGLGLSISQTLVGLLEGEITVTSSPGHGSRFSVYLPINLPEPNSLAVGVEVMAALESIDPVPQSSVDEPELGQAEPTSNGRPGNALDDHPFAGMHILVVDDDFRNVFALTALLERGDATVAVAENGISAITVLQQVPSIDLVLMDIMMPGMDGYATTRTIRKIEQFVTLPIIAVTGKVLSGERERCIDAGASDYVSKPVNSAELLKAIAPWIPVRIRSKS